MKKLKNFFDNLDKIDLKIMKIGIKISFVISLIATILLAMYLFSVHSLFLYNIGLAIFKLSTYIAVEFIVCGVIADLVKRQVDL